MKARGKSVSEASVLFASFQKLAPEARLGIYVVALYAIFMTWGFLQEKITTATYFASSSSNDEAVAYSWAYPMMLNALQTGSACATGALIEAAFGGTREQKISPMNFWRLSLSAALASPIGYYSLKFISYPMMILMKSCKPVPVMFVGTVFYRKTYSWFKYASVLLLCSGISLFTTYKASAKSGGSETVGDSIYIQIFGLCLVLLNLLLDGITNNEQDHVFAKHQPSTLQMMKFTNGWQAMYLSSYLLADLVLRGSRSDLANGCFMLFSCHGIGRDIMIFCICSCLGQLLVFGFIREFGSLVWITVAVSRQLFTILLSVFLFGHAVNIGQWMGILLVFSGLGLEIYYNYTNSGQNQAAVEEDLDSSNGLIDVESVHTSASPKVTKRRKRD